jgi:uroporphyrin-III C-methyltransferase
MIDLPRSSLGFVWLVGAGPGAIDLITVRGLNLLREADAVVCDDLVNRELLQHCRPEAEQHFAGKRAGCHSSTQAEINALLVALGRAGKKTVRLKGGDPLIFGRAGEELQALRAAGIPYAIVPGVTAATAASAAAGLVLTHREHASAVIFITGHQCADNNRILDWALFARSRATLCFYMGVRSLPEIAAQLMQHGMAADMSLAVISEASWPTQKISYGTLDRVGELVAGVIGQPALIIVGLVARPTISPAELASLQAGVRENFTINVSV